MPRFCRICTQIAPQAGLITSLSVGQQNISQVLVSQQPPQPPPGSADCSSADARDFFHRHCAVIYYPFFANAEKGFFLTQRLAGRRAIITGAASGIGLATAKLFAQEGAMVLAVDLPSDKLVQAFEGSSIATHGQSVTDSDAPDQILDAARRLMGGVDILFNNAGIATNSLVERTSDADWDQTLDVNLRAMFRLTRAAIPDLKASAAGRIINTASVMAEGSGMGLAAYSASKSGVQGFTRALAIELGKYGVTANWLLPGAIRTGMTQGIWEQRPEIADTWANKAVLRRLGEPDDIAKVALFLASADAGFITGQGLCVDGGLSLRVGG